MAPPRAAKVSISLPGALAKKLKRHVGRRGVSAFAARAIEEELKREERQKKLAAFLADLDSDQGPVDPADLEEARALWREVSS